MTIDQKVMHKYLDLKEKLILKGYAHEIDWAENVKPVKDSESFLFEFAWVVVNSGMKNQVAKKIYKKILEAWASGKKVHDVFNHKGKADAMEMVKNNRQTIFKEYLNTNDKLQLLKNLPWIGDITKYHLAKNLGLDCCKPDRHLMRIADSYDTTPFDLCDAISKRVGDRIGTVDVVWWRSANLGLV